MRAKKTKAAPLGGQPQGRYHPPPTWAKAAGGRLTSITDGEVSGFRQLPDEDVWLGSITVLGRFHHCQLIRVRRNRRGEQVPTKDPHGRFEDMLTLYSVHAFEEVRVAGLPGTYVVLIHPGEE